MPRNAADPRRDRRRTLTIALLPCAGALLLVGIGSVAADAPLAQVLVHPSLPIVLFVTVACTYLSALWGVAPLLWICERSAWNSPWHVAWAGYASVVLPWLALLVGVAVLRHGAGGHAAPAIPWGTLLGALSVPGVIAAIAAVVYWWICERDAHAGADRI